MFLILKAKLILSNHFVQNSLYKRIVNTTKAISVKLAARNKTHTSRRLTHAL